jgi:hypothetical protein
LTVVAAASTEPTLGLACCLAFACCFGCAFLVTWTPATSPVGASFARAAGSGVAGGAAFPDAVGVVAVDGVSGVEPAVVEDVVVSGGAVGVVGVSPRQ